ncbi:MAG TPA: pyridoxamine 5'-phosphate oxidase family protein [Pyrinomonadaceae bacterium]|nr:pyridoxamine 5'-phosphate oxidase family protein [Pyrinomonadaceae bacterium]
MNDSITQTDRTRLRRLPKRGVFDRAAVNAILDEAFICHIGFVADGQPYVIPTGFGRLENDLYIHGSSASRMLRTLSDGINMCFTTTLVDGLVLARSAFHHSVNYRSIVVLGRARLVEDMDEKNRALEVITNHIVPERWDDVRWPTELELKATSVLKLPINEASAKVRTGPPIDDDEDYAMNVWAGVLPIGLQTGEPIADDRLPAGIDPPENVRNYTRIRR